MMKKKVRMLAWIDIDILSFSVSEKIITVSACVRMWYKRANKYFLDKMFS